MYPPKNPEENLPSQECDMETTKKSSIIRVTHSRMKSNPRQCYLCLKEFKRIHTVRRHLKIHSGEDKKWPCSKCKMKFTKKIYVKRHMKIHSGKAKKYPCHKCNMKFTSKSYINIHMLTHSTVKAYECSMCHKKFTFECTLKKHLNIHTGADKKQCPICKAFYRDLKLHMVVHQERKPKEKVTCPVCKIQVMHLQLHMKIHGPRKVFNCKDCDKTFTNKGNLNRHRLIHKGFHKKECPICHGHFSEISQHMKVHSGEKNHVCPECSRAFTQKGNLDRHILNVHTENTKKQCHICKGFYVDLKAHLTFGPHSENIYECTTCGLKLATPASLRKHLMTHENIKTKCTICKKEFADIKRHTKIMHSENSGRFTCNICGKSIARKETLKNHMQCHYESTYVQCNICKINVHSREQKQHMVIHTKTVRVVLNTL